MRGKIGRSDQTDGSDQEPDLMVEGATIKQILNVAEVLKNGKITEKLMKENKVIGPVSLKGILDHLRWRIHDMTPQEVAQFHALDTYERTRASVIGALTAEVNGGEEFNARQDLS